ncbi:MAG TPA: 16S rRNA (cytosine(1402)-N(4))-methyltransferase RsmH [Candidatus Saccharimonadales bacterium]|nr:16S rRNA (cytosine(1402)-N(4))-methyltransferase RsmH [Candidatus Saccharimonadales bacterium]
MHEQISNEHVPVLLDGVLAHLAPSKGESYLDLTAGYGGHATAILERTKAYSQATLVDRDSHAIAALQTLAAKGALLIHQDFLSATKALCAEGKQFDIILADLGLSSPHLDNAARGFAFRQDGPLDMRMDQSQSLNAATVVNTYSIDDLVRIIKEYGEEPRAKRIAEAIVAARPLATTQELAEVIRSVMPKGSKTHPATKTFQALRIAVNDELGLLRAALPLWIDLLKPGGRVGVISFHSLEDRLVKQAFAELAGERYDAPLRLLTKHPVVADEHELFFNPRARSAKLRVAVKK